MLDSVDRRPQDYTDFGDTYEDRRDAACIHTFCQEQSAAVNAKDLQEYLLTRFPFPTLAELRVEQPTETTRPFKVGGFGRIDLVRDHANDRRVVLKSVKRALDSDVEWRRLIVEARLMSFLEHPGVPPVFFLAEWEGRPCYAMPNYGEHARLLDHIGKLESRSFYKTARFWNRHDEQLRDLLEMFIHLCGTVQYAHSRGIIHRDINPNNIVIDSFGAVVLLDWGLARPYAEGNDAAVSDRIIGELEPERIGASCVTQPSALGTPEYFSPEQAAFKTDLKPESDIANLGATLYHLLTGRPPYERGKSEVAERAGFRPPREVNPALPEPLAAICCKAMAREPADRYASAADLALDLTRWLADIPLEGCRESWRVKLPRWMRRHPRRIAALVTVLALAVPTLWILRDRAEREQARTSLALARAETNLETAFDAIDQFLAQVGDKHLTAVPHAEATRRALLEAALQLCQKLLLSQPEHAKARQETARAYGRLATIYRLLGRSDEARNASTEAIRLQAALVQEFPTTAAFRKELALSHDRQGNLLRLVGEKEAAEAAYRAALTHWENLIQSYPEELRYPLERLGTVQNLCSLIYRDGNRQDEALRLLEGARSECERMAPTQAEDIRLRSTWGAVLNNLGTVTDRKGRRAEAIGHYEGARELWTKLVQENPDPAYRCHLAESLNNLSLALYREPQRLAEAERYALEAKAILDQLAADHSETQRYAILRAILQTNLGKVFQQAKKADLADAQFGSAIGVFDKLEAADARQTEVQRHLPIALAGRAELRRRRGELKDAESDYLRAVQVAPASSRESYRLGWSAARAGQPDKCEHAIVEATNNPLCQMASPPPAVLYNFACIHAIAAGTAQTQGRAELARRYTKRAIELLRQAAAARFFKSAIEKSHFREDPDLTPLRQHPDFLKLERELQ